MFWRKWPREFQIFFFGAVAVTVIGASLVVICLPQLLSYF